MVFWWVDQNSERFANAVFDIVSRFVRSLATTAVALDAFGSFFRRMIPERIRITRMTAHGHSSP
jgi:hypothetical protein